MRPPKINRLYEVMEVNGVKVYAHWSVLLIGAIVSLGAISEPATAIPGLICYYGVILLHERGHMVFAQRKHCAVWSIELYPIWGITRFSEPYSLSSPSKWVHLRSSANACVDSRLVSCRAAGYVIHLDMKTLTVRLPEPLVADIEAESRGRKISKSDVVRERLELAPRKRRRATSLNAIADLIGSVDNLPADLTARKKQYLQDTGYGQKRPR
jgi:Arc/MetJ-type ribon-helix-helix transcriptional regulator